MRQLWILLLLLAAVPAHAKPPRLTLFITVDSLGSDLFLRSRPYFKSGLAQLAQQGAYFPFVRYEYAETVTAAGHATLATGANPWRHGVISNRIFNRATGKDEAILADANHPLLEAPNAPEDVSPENLAAETVADRLRLASRMRSKVVAISSKGRSAVPLAGRLGQAWWFNDSVGKFVTGTFYAKELPVWVKAFNDKKQPDATFGKSWVLALPSKEYLGEDDRPFETDWFGMGRRFPHPVTGGLSAPGPQFYQALAASPFMTELLGAMAKAAIDGEQLGKDEVPDLLAVSFSPIDRIYHLFGPYSWEMQDALLRLDKVVGELVAAAERAAGRGNVAVVLTGDHGGAAVAEEWAAAGMSASRVNQPQLEAGLGKELQTRFGAPDLVVGIEEVDVYLSSKVVADKKLDGAAVRRAAAAWLASQPQVLVAIARDDLNGASTESGYLRALRLGYYPGRSGDVLFLLRPFNVLSIEPAGTSHGTPYAYDAQVPLLVWGRGARPGTYLREVPTVDVAPTLTALLEVGSPAMAEGSPIPEALSPTR